MLNQVRDLREELEKWRNRCVERDWTLGIWGHALQGIADASPQSWDWYQGEARRAIAKANENPMLGREVSNQESRGDA